MTSKNFQPTGWHYLLELFECSAGKIDDLEFVLSCLREAAGLAKTEVVDIVSQRFQPHGVTAIALLKESHLSIHCWPENQYAAVDLFSCGENGTPQTACDFLIEQFESQQHQLQVIKRGLTP